MQPYLVLHAFCWHGHLVDWLDSIPLSQYSMVAWLQTRWGQLEELYHNNMVKAIGLRDCTVYQLQQLMASSNMVPSVVSVEVHPFYKNEELVTFCKKKVSHYSKDCLGHVAYGCLLPAMLIQKHLSMQPSCPLLNSVLCLCMGTLVSRPSGCL